MTTLDDYKAKDNRECPYCHRELTKEFLAARMKQKSDSQRWAIQRRKEQGLPVGRTPSAPVEKIIAMREAGVSIRKIAKELKCASSTVQSVLKREL